MGNFNDLVTFFRANQNVRVLLLDNNNLEFCTRYETSFPMEQIYSAYDLILVPGWVHQEITHSQNRLNYLSRIPKELIILLEEDDYLGLVAYEDERLVKLFEFASAPYPASKRFFNRLKEIIRRTGYIPDNWIDDYYANGFDIKLGANGQELKKNAGEISLLTLSFLLYHYFGNKIKHVTISSSDMGSYDIKETILRHLHKQGILNVSPNEIQIGFKSTDGLLVEGYQSGRLTLQDVVSLRTNPRSAIYIQQLSDASWVIKKDKIKTPDFLTILQNLNDYKFVF